jgi:hypothetical protein
MEPASIREEAQEAQQDAVIARPPAPQGHVALLRGTSNAAVSTWIARNATVARETKAADREAMEALEQRMAAIKEAASARSTSLAEISDQCVKDLQEATKHLKASNENYKAAYGQFKGVLDQADETFEMEEAIVDAVQGILIAAALAIIGPETLLVGGAIRGLEAAAVKNSGKLAGYGFTAGAKALGGGAGEIGEQIAGGALTAGQDPVRPSATAAAAGATTGDKYEEAFGKLDVIVGTMPRLGKPTILAKDIAVAAGDLATEAVRLAAGTAGKWTESELKEKSDGVAAINDSSSGDLLNARLAGGQVLGLKNAIVGVEIKEVDAIERMLWLNWMASLEGGRNEALDNDDIQEHLEGMGMIDAGDWMSDSDQAEIVGQARRDWLAARGIEVPERRLLVDNLYRREMKLDELERRLLGKHGVISSTNRVTVDGKVFHATGMMGGEVGDEVVVSFIRVKDHLQDPGTLNAHWADTDYEVMGSTVTALDNAGRG